jgi:hypothetical protein
MKQGRGYFYYNNGELYIGDWYGLKYLIKIKGLQIKKMDMGGTSI